MESSQVLSLRTFVCMSLFDKGIGQPRCPYPLQTTQALRVPNSTWGCVCSRVVQPKVRPSHLQTSVSKKIFQNGTERRKARQILVM
jgi:hypothetical protein